MTYHYDDIIFIIHYLLLLLRHYFHDTPLRYYYHYTHYYYYAIIIIIAIITSYALQPFTYFLFELRYFMMLSCIIFTAARHTVKRVGVRSVLICVVCYDSFSFSSRQYFP